MRYFIIFLFSFLFAFKNDLYLTMLENNLIVNYLNSIKLNRLKLNPKTRQILNVLPNKFFIANAKIDTKGDKKISLGIEFDLNKKITKTILTNNKDIFKIAKIFNKNQQIIQCYNNKVLFNLKKFFVKAKKYDNFYSRFLPILENIQQCNTNKKINFFNLTKAKNDFYPVIALKKIRDITSSINLNANQDTSTYISVSFNIKIPLQKSYNQEDLSRLQQINNSINKINTLILSINNSIEKYYKIKRSNKIILKNLKLLTLISKIAPANINYDKLINLYETFFNNLEEMNNIQKNIFINKFLLKTEKRKLREY